MGRALNQLIIGIATIYCAYWLMEAVRNEYFQGSRRYGHRKVYRDRQPRLYWFNVVVMAVFFVLGLLFLGWGLLPSKTFH